MYESTGVCPYTDRCESFQSILRVEGQLLRARREAFFGRTEVPPGELYRILDSFHTDMEKINNAKERCIKFHYRCLRFWQLNKKEREEKGYTGLDDDVISLKKVTSIP